jgi:hypothetical protein
MTRKEFEALEIGSWFHSIYEDKEFKITSSDIYGHHVIEYNLRNERQAPDFWYFRSHEHLALGRFPTLQGYIPKHNELCTILTKNGLGTKAIAVHYNGKISAISIDNEGNADCHFKAEQIEKFFPFTQ